MRAPASSALPRWRTFAVAALSVAAVLAANGSAHATSQRARAAAEPALPGVVRAVEAARRGAPIPARLRPPIKRIKLFPREHRISPSCLAHGADPPTASRVCRVGERSSTKLIVVFGDSHAFMWLPAILELAQRDGCRVVPLIRFGCTPGKWTAPVWPAMCQHWFRWGIRQIRSLDPDVTLLGGSIQERPSRERAAAVAGVIGAARTLRGLGRLVVIGDPEGLAGDPVPCLVAPGASMSTCTTTWPPASLAAYDEVARATQRLGVGFLPTRGFVCHRRRCPAVVGRTIVWMDNSHITGVYSAELAGPFGDAFLRALQ